MTKKEEKHNADKLISAQWQSIGAGSFNHVFLSRKPITLVIDGKPYTNKWVRKIPLARSLQSQSQRAVRVWNELHPSRPGIISPIARKEWLAPYLGAVKASDKLTAMAVIDVYRRTGRIVIDACGVGNTLVVGGMPNIIDIDLALRPGSSASDDFDRREVRYHPKRCGYDSFWSGNEESMPKTVNTIKSLCFLQFYLGNTPEIYSKITPQIVEKIHLLRSKQTGIDKEDYELLQKTPPKPTATCTFFPIESHTDKTRTASSILSP